MNSLSGRRSWNTIVPVASSVRMPRLRSQLRGSFLQASAPTSGSPRGWYLRTELTLERAAEVARLEGHPVRVADAAAELEGVPRVAGRDHRQRDREVRHDLAALATAASRRADETVVGRAQRRLRAGPGHVARVDGALRSTRSPRRPAALPGGPRRRPGPRARRGRRRGRAPSAGSRSGSARRLGSPTGRCAQPPPRTHRSPRRRRVRPRCRRAPRRPGSWPGRDSCERRCARPCRRASSRPTRSRRRTATPVGPLPTPTVSTTRPRRASMRTTLRLDSSVTHTLPPPTAMPRPSAPVGIVSTTRPRRRRSS